jgi:hypothetical protein
LLTVKRIITQRAWLLQEDASALGGRVKENKRNGIPAMFRESADNT